MNKERTEARIQALEECADHLELHWTDDNLEREEGMKLAGQLRRKVRELSESV